MRNNIDYYQEQLEQAKYDYSEVIHRKDEYMSTNRADEWMREYEIVISAVKDTETNLSTECKMHNSLMRRLNNNDFTSTSTSTSTKRGFSDYSMANDDSSKSSKINKKSDE